MADKRSLGLDEILIVNPSPVGAPACRFTPVRLVRVRPVRAAGLATQRGGLGEAPTPRRGFALVRPGYYQDPEAGTYQII